MNMKYMGRISKLAKSSQTGCSGHKKWETMGSPVPGGTEIMHIFTGNTGYFENIDKRRLMSDERQLSNVICYDMTVFVLCSGVFTAHSQLSG